MLTNLYFVGILLLYALLFWYNKYNKQNKCDNAQEEQKEVIIMATAEEARRSYRKEYREKNRDRINAYHREWAKNNPEKIKEHQDRYWQKKAGGE